MKKCAKCGIGGSFASRTKRGIILRDCYLCRSPLCEKHLYLPPDLCGVLCTNCWKIYQPFKKRLEIERRRYDTAMGRIMAELQRALRKKKKRA